MSTRLDLLPARPGHAVLFTTSVPLFLGALLADWAYSSTFVIQWINFASWLNAGALIIVGAALFWSLIDLFRDRIGRDHRSVIYVGIIMVVFIVGFLTALVHAKDAWATMPAALILSIIVFLLAVAATWIGLNARERGLAR